MMRQICIGIAVAMGAAAIVNGLYMLAVPLDWYFAIPGVTTTGPYNQHFIRDIGLVFLFIGGAFVLGAAKAEHRVLLWSGATIWLAGHSLFHFWEVAAGICGSEVIARDFPAVTLPALLGLFLSGWAIRDHSGARNKSLGLFPQPVHLFTL